MESSERAPMTDVAAHNPAAVSPANIPPRILVIGGGYVGMYTARRILKNLKRGEAIVTRGRITRRLNRTKI